MWWYVYILKCSDGTYYTGCTNNLKDRLQRHDWKQIHYTKSRLPVELQTCIAFKDKIHKVKYN
jgi:putative endonuclease